MSTTDLESVPSTGSGPDPVLGDLAPEQVRVRFPPSPTGNLHVGNVRSALFNWVFARHYGGTFVLRIEDTDAGRNLAESYRGLMDALTWLGLDWDEGPQVGGPYGPYVQSERGEIYTEVTAKLLESGLAYRCYCTREELEEREKARPKGSPSGYDGHCRDLTADQVAAYAEEGRTFVVRMRVPDAPITFHDLVRGEITFEAVNVPDYVLVRGTGEPLYTLVNPVDDALMEITHVLRGEDLLPSTPRQVVLYQALAQIGVGSGRVPTFGHLPTVLGDGNRRLSKRDKGSGLAEYREQGYLPEALLNYLALLGLGDRRRPRRVHHRGDGGGVRHPAGQRQPGEVRRQEVRGHQRRAHPAAVHRRAGRPAGAVPGHRRARGRAADAGAVVAAGRRRPADPGADDHPVGGGGADPVPVHRRRRRGDRRGGEAAGHRRAPCWTRRRRRCEPWSRTTTRPSRQRCGRP